MPLNTRIEQVKGSKIRSFSSDRGRIVRGNRTFTLLRIKPGHRKTIAKQCKFRLQRHR